MKRYIRFIAMTLLITMSIGVSAQFSTSNNNNSFGRSVNNSTPFSKSKTFGQNSSFSSTSPSQPNLSTESDAIGSTPESEKDFDMTAPPAPDWALEKLKGYNFGEDDYDSWEYTPNGVVTFYKNGKEVASAYNGPLDDSLVPILILLALFLAIKKVKQ